ncbi:MAG: leucine-rich repeat domain-containing protein [Bacteroidales bacterium]|nr:leucine-rich repeat domain-containing protein [Bacteroidales bacterium]
MTAIFSINQEPIPFREWLQQHRHADCIAIKGVAKKGILSQFDVLASCDGLTINISELCLLTKLTHDNFQHEVEECYENYWDTKGKNLPLIVVLIANRQHALDFVVDKDYIFTSDRQSIVYFKTKAADIDLSTLNIKHIGNFASHNNQHINGIVFPDSLSTIGNYAFSYCEKLNRIVFPQKMESLGAYCFQSTEVEEVILPEGLEEIPPGCFAYCRIRKISFPSTLKAIRWDSLFFDDYADVVIPEGVVTIESRAIVNAATIHFPSTLRELDYDFYYDYIVGSEFAVKPSVSVHPDNRCFYSLNGTPTAICRLCVRFKYKNAPALSCHIVELTDVQWRQFEGLHDVEKRMNWMLNHLHMDGQNILEMWWIPLANQSLLTINNL